MLTPAKAHWRQLTVFLDSAFAAMTGELLWANGHQFDSSISTMACQRSKSPQEVRKIPGQFRLDGNGNPRDGMCQAKPPGVEHLAVHLSKEVLQRL